MTIQSAMEIALIKAHIVRMQYEYADLPEEEQKEQELVDDLYQQFLEAVAEGRLVLADVLDVAVERGAAKIVDLGEDIVLHDLCRLLAAQGGIGAGEHHMVACGGGEAKLAMGVLELAKSGIDTTGQDNQIQQPEFDMIAKSDKEHNSKIGNQPNANEDSILLGNSVGI